MLACIAAVASITTTVGTATFTGGVVAFALASQQTQAAVLTSLATMSDLVTTGSKGAGVIDNSGDGYTSYIFHGQGSITGITNQGVVDALDAESGYVTIAAWVRSDSATGVKSIFSYGAQSNGFKFCVSNETLQYTDKGVADRAVGGTITAGEWTLVALTINVDNSNSSKYLVGESAEFTRTCNWADPGASKTFGIGSGNGDGDREVFRGEIANLTIFTSTEAATNADILALMGSETPVFTLNLVWDKDASDNNWSGSSWKEGDTSQVWQDKANVVFSGIGETVLVDKNVRAATVQVLGESWIFSGTDTNLNVYSGLTVGDGTEATSLKIAGNILTSASTTVKNGAVLELAPGVEATLASIVGSMTAEEGSTIKISGSGTEISYTGNALDRANIVVDGATLSLERTDSGPSMRGDVKLQNNALLKISNSNDSFNWGDANKIEVLNSEMVLSNHRISVNGSDKIILNNGKITGTGDQHGALDFFDNNTVISNGTSEITAPIRLRADVTFDVESGTLTIGQLTSDGEVDGKLIKTGAGIMKLVSSADGQADSIIKNGLEISAGEVQVAGVVNMQGTSNLAAGTTLAIKSGGNLTLAGTITWNSDVVVEADGTLVLTGLHTVNNKLTVNAGGKVYAGPGMTVDTDSMVTPAAGTNGWETGTVTLLKASGDGTVTGLTSVWQDGVEQTVTATTHSGETIYTFEGRGSSYYVQDINTAAEYSSAAGLTAANTIYMSDNTTLLVRENLSITSDSNGKVVVAEGGRVKYDVEGATLTMGGSGNFNNIASLNIGNGGTVMLSAWNGSLGSDTSWVDMTLSNGGKFAFQNGNSNSGGGAMYVNIVVDGDGKIAGSALGNNSNIRGTVKGHGTLTLCEDMGNIWTISGVISDGDGAEDVLSVSKTGTSKVQLSGNNSYTGGTTITGGTIVAANETAFGAGDVTFSGGKLEQQADLTIGGNLALNAEYVHNGHTLMVRGNMTNNAAEFVASNLTVDGNFTLTGDNAQLKFASGASESAMTVVTLNGAENSLSRIDLTSGQNATLVLGENSVTTLTGNGNKDNALWLGSTANHSSEVLLGRNSTLILPYLNYKDNKVTIVATGEGASVANTHASEGKEYEAASTDMKLTDVSISVDTIADGHSLTNVLVNSSVINTGAGLLTVQNDDNILTGVTAQGGNVKVVNSATGQVSIGSVTAASGKSVTAEIADLSLGALTLNGGTFSTNGNLLLNALSVDVLGYGFDAATETERVIDLVTAAGTLTLADGLDLSTLVSDTDDFEASLSQDGNKIQLTLESTPVDDKTYYWEGEDEDFWGDENWSQKDGKTTNLINIADPLPDGNTEADLTLVFSNAGTADNPNTMKLNAAKVVTAIVVKNGYYEFTEPDNGGNVLTCTGDLTLAAADAAHNLVGGHLELNKNFKAANVNMGAGSSLEINKTLVLTGSADTEENDGQFIIQGAGASLVLGSNFILSNSQIDVSASGASLVLSGSGTYDLGGNTMKASLAEGWTGTVVVSGAKNNLNLNDYGHAGSTIEFKGWSTYLYGVANQQATYTYAANLKFTDVGDTAAFDVNNGFGGNTYKFTGTVEGSGTFKRSSVGSELSFVFEGETKSWDGAFMHTTADSRYITNVTFNGSTEINARLERSEASTNCKFNVTIDDANISGTDKSVDVNGAVEALSLTLGLAADTADTRAAIALNGAVTVGTLNNYATTTISSATSVTSATTLGADVTVSGEGASLSLAGTVNTTAAATVTGATVAAGGISTSGAGALTLTNTTLGGNITNTGTLTMSGTIKATASATVSGATVGGNTVTCDEGATLTLQNTSITSAITNNGTLVLTGTVDAGVAGTGPEETYSNTTTGNGYQTLTTEYELVSGTEATATDVTWTVGGEALDTAETPTFNGYTLKVATTDSVNYYINYDAEYANTDTEYDAAGALKLNGAELTLTTALNDGVGITVAADNSSIKLDGAGVELASSSITNTDNKEVSLKGTGIYNVGSALVLEKAVVLDSTDWTGTIRTTATQSTVAYTADSQLFGGSKIDLTANTFTARDDLYAGATTGKALTLLGDANTLSSLELSGKLTLGSADVASELTVTNALKVATIDVVNLGSTLSAGSLTGGTAISISDDLLADLAASESKSLTILTLGAKPITTDTDRITINGKDWNTSFDSGNGQYNYTLEWKEETKSLVVQAALNGAKWNDAPATEGGDYRNRWYATGIDTVDLPASGWSTAPQSTESVVFSDPLTDEDGNQISGSYSCDVIVNGAVEVNNLTVDLWNDGTLYLEFYGGQDVADTTDSVTIQNNMTVAGLMKNVIIGELYTLNNEITFTPSTTDPISFYIGKELSVQEGVGLNVATNGSVTAGSLKLNGWLGTHGDIKVEGDAAVAGVGILYSGALYMGQERFAAQPGLGHTPTISIEGNLSNASQIINMGCGELSVKGTTTNSGSIWLITDIVMGEDFMPKIDEDGNVQMISGGKVTLGAEDPASTVTSTSLANSGTVVVEDGTLIVNGSMTNTGADIPADSEAPGLSISGGTVTITGNLDNDDAVAISGGKVSIGGDLDNSASVTISGGEVDITGALNNGDTVSITDATVSAGSVDNDGTITVTGSSLTTGAMDNAGGSISITGTAAAGETPAKEGSLVVNGSLTNTTAGTITIGTADDAAADGDQSLVGKLTVTGDLNNAGGTVTVAGTGSSVEVGGDMLLADVTEVDGEVTVSNKGSLSVGAGTDLSVDGDLVANTIDLGFDGSVTVGGDAMASNISIHTGASFTAANATITDTLIVQNGGSLSVGELNEEGELTGGNLTVGTLSGSGEVHVGTDGMLTIGNDHTFNGVLDNKGGLTFTDVDEEGNVVYHDAVLNSAQTEGQTAGDITASSITVSSKAVGTVVEGEGAEAVTKSTTFEMGTLVTDSLIIDGIDSVEVGARLALDSIETLSTEEGAKVTLTLSQINDKTLIEGTEMTKGESFVNGIIDAVNAAETGADELKAVTYHLMDIAGVTSLDTFELNIDADREQQILAAGQIAELWDGTTPTVAMMRALGGTDVYLKVREQTQKEATWDTSDLNTDTSETSTAAGLIVGTVADGVVKLKNAAILDNVDVVNVTIDTTIDLNETDTAADAAAQIHGLSGTNTLTVQGESATGDTADYVEIDDHMKDADGNATRGELGGMLKLDGVTATLDLSGDTVDVTMGDVALKGDLTGGSISIDAQEGVDETSTLDISATDLNISNYKGSADMTGVSETNQVLVDLGNMTGTAGDIDITGEKAEDIYLLEKYFTNIRFDEEEGAVVADRNTSYFSDNFTAESANGEAGMTLADAALLKLNPQMDKDSSDLGAMLTAIENAGSTTARDELAASLAGASSAVLGMAVSGDVDRQLRAIRNRTTTMGVDQSVANEDMPYFNAWINAEGSMNELSDNGTEGGYKLNSWGGTVGFDVDICPTFTAGMAFTAMYGDLDVTGADTATGDLDTYYLSAFARYSESAWTHTFVATVGTGDISLKRTVLGSEQKVETDALSFGLMYEVGRVFALDEDGSACLQPVFNVTWKHTTVDGYTEDGSDLALKVDEQTVDTVTFGLGARLQAVVGESMYNRTSIFEARVLAKADVGDRNGSTDVGLASLGCTEHEVESAEMGAFGLEAGAGLTIPVGEEGGSIFMDASVELRSDYTDVNGTVGYRINF